MTPRKGTLCQAPIKSPTAGRKMREVRVTWVSDDGRVVEVETTRGTPRTEAFAVPRLRWRDHWRRRDAEANGQA